MKTVAIGGFFHESNTFNPIITGIDDFNIFEADEFGDKKESYLLAKGMVDFFEEHSDYYKVLPLIFARAVPNGEIDRKLYQSLKDRFFELLSQGGVPDVFVLPLHGSMRIEGIGSAESDLLADIKARYPEVPIILGLDMHATITESMLAHTEGMVGFKLRHILTLGKPVFKQRKWRISSSKRKPSSAWVLKSSPTSSPVKKARRIAHPCAR